MAELDGQPIYDDTMHLGPAGQRWIGQWILGTLQHEVTGHRTRRTPTTGPCTLSKGERASRVRVRSYTAPSSKLYPDSAQHKLTDHRTGKPIVFDDAWVGWHAKSGEVKLTLPRAEPICGVDTNWLQELDAAVYPPPGIAVFVSNRPNRLGAQLGTTTAPQLSSDNQAASESVSAPDPIKGRYVTLQVSALTGWSFLDEVSVSGLPIAARHSHPRSQHRNGDRS
jgi:hypothetical protein